MKSILLATLLAVAIGQTQAQPFYKSYKWDAAKIHTSGDKWKDAAAWHVLHNRIQEVRMLLSGGAMTLFTEHKITHINNAAGLERFNKVYIPLRAAQTIVALEVRAIAPDGKVTVLRKENLKELTNVEGYGNFKIFAVEGLAIGGEMEYIYTTEAPPQSYGRYMIQTEAPVQQSSIVLLSPLHLYFTAKGYNKSTMPEYSTFEDSRRMVTIENTNVPAVEEEEYAAHTADRMRVDYMLDRNETPTMTWETISQAVVTNNYEPKAGPKVAKLLKSVMNDKMSVLEKVTSLENYIKTNFTVKDGGADFEDTKTVVERRVGNERGMLKLYMACWEEMGLRPQLVIGTNRFQGRLDPDFANPADISNILFYFTGFDRYLIPEVPYTRLGKAPDILEGSTAVFVDFDFVDYKATYKKHTFQKIAPSGVNTQNQGVNALVRFNDRLDLPDITQETFWQGSRAIEFRGVYFYAPEDRRDEFLKELTLSGLEDVTVKARTVEGDGPSRSVDPDSYVRIKTNYTSPELIEQAGEDYLLSIGKLIGRQSELYQEKSRVHAIEFHSVANYNHELVVDIPPGYSLSGLDGIKIKNELQKGNESVMGFHSDYELAGNKLTVRIKEFYKVLQLPKEDYDQFRKVINSAADFNKVVLVLSPQPK